MLTKSYQRQGTSSLKLIGLKGIRMGKEEVEEVEVKGIEEMNRN